MPQRAPLERLEVGRDPAGGPASGRRETHDERTAVAGAALDLAAYKTRPTDTNKDEAKAAIKALEAKIDQLEDRADNMPRGADRDALKRRVDALEDRKDELEKEFNKTRFNALVDDVQSEWNHLVH